MEESVRSAAFCGAEEESVRGAAFCGADEEGAKGTAFCGADEEGVKGAAFCGADEENDGQPWLPQSFDESLQSRFALPQKDWTQYSPLTLAYLGDAVFDLVVRTIAVKRENRQPQKLHREVTACVSAKAQSRMTAQLLPLLDEEEAAVYRRGRNAKPYTKAKNATMKEYLEATGLEALFGYLYLCGRFERLQELIALGLQLLRDDGSKLRKSPGDSG